MPHILFLLISINQSGPVNYIRYYETIHAAEYQYEYKKNPAKALVLLSEAEHLAGLGPLETELKAQCYLQLGDTGRSQKYLKQAIALGSTDPDHFRVTFSHLSKWRMEQVMKEYPELVRRSFCGKDVPLLLELSSMTAHDQFVRKERSHFREERADWLLGQVDSANICHLKELYEKSGVLPPAFILYWHGLMAYPRLWSYFEPEMRKGIFNGTFSPQSYALLYDRLRVEVEKKNSWYGEYTASEMPDASGGKVEDVAHVDERRKAIGLRPLIEMKEMWGWTMPPGYHAPAFTSSN